MGGGGVGGRGVGWEGVGWVENWRQVITSNRIVWSSYESKKY